MPFKPGQSGNPNGRPKGARDSLKNNFLTALAEDFREHGVGAIVSMRTDDPSGYVKAICSLMPKELTLSHDDPLEQLTDEQLAAIIALAEYTANRIAGGEGEGSIADAEGAKRLSEFH